MPDDAIVDLGIDGHTAIVALTHDPKLDDMALLEALKSPRAAGRDVVGVPDSGTST